MLEHALRYAKEFGWHVFPCCPWTDPKNAPPEKRGKAPLTSNGLKDATNNELQIKRWWSQWPYANIGLACGVSGIVVVDIDGPEGWRQIEYGGHELPDTLVARTGKPQGAHYYFKAGTHGIRNGLKIFGKQTDREGVDVRGDGGYVIIPPSKHYSGKLYEFDDDSVPIAPAPAWLVHYQQGRTGDLKEARALIADPAARIYQTERNTTLHRVGCVYRRDNMIQDVDIMTAMLMAENHRRCEPPLDAAEVRKIAAQAVKVLPDEIELIVPPGWEDWTRKAAAQTGDATLIAQADAVITKVKDRTPDHKPGEFSLSLTRYTVPGVTGGTFSVTVSFRNEEATLYGICAEDLNSPDRMKAKLVAEKLVTPVFKRRAWDALIARAMRECPDVEVQEESSVVGACIEAIRDLVDRLSPTTDWADFPIAAERAKFDHGDGSVSVHSGTLRAYLRRRVWDAKRGDVTRALDTMGASAHRPDGRVTMQRLHLSRG